MSGTGFTFSLAGNPYLEFLPVVDLQSGRLLGLEALVRWQHPTEGVIPPGLLIPQAEASGDIEALTQWVLHDACSQARGWSSSIQLGVNCAIEQLRRGEVSRAVEQALGDTGLPSGQLTLEVTEEAISDPSASADLINLSRLGVQLSVDDVGTNWSSFEPFSRHAISTVKIDGSFIAGLESTQGINRLVVETVIHMAHSLGMSALVEQVETAPQVEIVRSFGADAAQGFFFALPMSSEAAADLARRDEVPHFSRTTERTLLRPVDDAPGGGAAAAVVADPPMEADDAGTGGADRDVDEVVPSGGEVEELTGTTPDAHPAAGAADAAAGPEVFEDGDTDVPVEAQAAAGRLARKRPKSRSSRSA